MQYLIIGIIIIIAILILLCFGKNMALTRFAICGLVVTLAMGIIVFGYGKIFINSSVDFTIEQNIKSLEYLTDLTIGLDKVDFSDEKTAKKFDEEISAVFDKFGIGEIAWGIASVNGSGYRLEFVKSNGNSMLVGNGITGDLEKAVMKTVDNNEISYSQKNNETVIYTVSDENELISSKVLCIETKLNIVKEAEDAFVHKYLKWLIFIWCGSMLIFAIITAAQAYEWRKMIDAITKTATGRNDIVKPMAKNHEMRTMWNALSELTKRVAKDNYEKYQALQAYYRFAPKRIENILKKETIQDVENGDLVKIEGTFTLAAAYAKNQIVATEENEINNIQQRFKVLSQYQENGVLVSSDSELHALKYLFIDDKAGALKFAYQSMLAVNSTNFIKKENMLFLVHHTAFTYGVTGNEEQTVPFMVSYELDILQKYVEPLSSLGIRIVVTEEMIGTLSNSAEYRYIGFVGKDSHNFKLYEILDVYPEIERVQRIRSNEKLQQGINLFYKDDFYLARNSFTEVIKDCPSDGLAKWYLFTCEYKLNHPDDKTSSYALFPEV